MGWPTWTPPAAPTAPRASPCLEPPPSPGSTPRAPPPSCGHARRAWPRARSEQHPRDWARPQALPEAPRRRPPGRGPPPGLLGRRGSLPRVPTASAAPRGAAPGPAPRRPCPARPGPEEGRLRAPRAGRQPGRGSRSSRHGAGARRGRSPGLAGTPRCQGFLKELSRPAARETKETKPTGGPGRPGLRSLRSGRPAARCRAGAPAWPWGPSASPLHISRASRSQPRWPPSSTGERVRGRGAPGTSKGGPRWRAAGRDPECGRSQAGELTGLGTHGTWGKLWSSQPWGLWNAPRLVRGDP